jgi:RluA family pseudouridine synthase
LLDILYQDDAVIAVAKPPGRIVIPGRGAAAAERTLRDELTAQLGGGPVFVVHRLDRGTSGALLFARTADAHRALSMAFERHAVDKRYWALCRGALIGTGEVARALVPIRGGKVRPAREGEAAGKPSVTAWRALERFRGGAFTAVELRPRSGRLHQVRAHAALLGHPLAVDRDYGGAAELRAGDLDPGAASARGADEIVVARPTLHAASLRLRHPATGAPLEIAAPLAGDLARAVELLRRTPPP